MIGTTGLLSGLTGKVFLALGIGAASVTATGAAGALPGPAQHVVAGVVNTVSPLHIPDVSSTSTTGVQAVVGTPAGANAQASGTVSGTGASATADAGTSATGPSALPGLPPVPQLPSGLPVPVPTLPDVGGSLPVPVPSCVASIVDPSTGHLLVAPAELSSKVLACVQSIVPAGTLPTSVSSCLTSVLGELQGLMGGGVPSGVPSLNVSGCVPVDASACVSSVVGAVGSNPLSLLGNLANLGNLTNLANAANLGNLPGCVPVNASTCVSSILGAVGSAGSSAGTVPHIDLSACLPTGLPSGLPIGH